MSLLNLIEICEFMGSREWQWQCVWSKSRLTYSYYYHVRLSDHITDALVCLHWLRMPERVQ